MEKGDKLMKQALFILGAPDDEMDAIKDILEALQVPYMLALDEHGKRVSLRSANKVSIAKPAAVYFRYGVNDPPPADKTFDGGMTTTPWTDNTYTHVFWVECTPLQLHEQWITNNCDKQYYINHHRPEDVGYGLPPEQYWSASSLGQVINTLRCPPRGLQIVSKNNLDVNVVIQPRLWLLEHIAAADHCLRAAYKGQCPGILPVSLRMWRLMSSSKQQNLSIDYCIHHQRQQIAEVLALPKCCLGAKPDTISELESYLIKDATGMNIYNAPELAYILDISIMFKRRNFICITNAEPWVIDLWVERYARDKLTDIYVDRMNGEASGKIIK